jgi:hypothetical protein
MWSSIHYCLGPLADPFKESSESSLPEDNKEVNKEDDKEEEKLPSYKHVKFKLSSMEDTAPPYADLYPSLAHFRLILTLVPYLRQEQKGERKMKFP